MKRLLVLLLFSASAMAQVSIGTGVQIGGGGTANPLDVSQIAASGEIVSTYQQSLVIPSNSTINLADIKGVSGTIVGFGLSFCPGTTCAGAGNVGSIVLSFYYDGNTGTPDMSFKFTNTGVSYQASNTTFQAQRLNSAVSNAVNGQGGFGFYYPMYFSTEWRMTATAPSSLTTGALAYLTVWYTTASTSGLRLHAQENLLQTVNLASTSSTLLNVASGSGIIAGATMSIQPGSQSDFTYSEANVQTYLDGASAIAQAIPAGGSSGTGCTAGDILGVTQGGGSGGQVMVVAVNSGAVTALTPVLTSAGTGYSTASGLATTAVSTTCSVRPTIYISTAQNSNDSIESWLQQSLEFGLTGTRQSNWGFVSYYGSGGGCNSGNNNCGYTVFFDILDQQKGVKFTNGAVIKWQADPVKAASIGSGAVTYSSVVWYYQ